MHDDALFQRRRNKQSCIHAFLALDELGISILLSLRADATRAPKGLRMEFRALIGSTDDLVSISQDFEYRYLHRCGSRCLQEPEKPTAATSSQVSRCTTSWVPPRQR